MKTRKKKIITIVAILSTLFFLLLIGAYSFKDEILQQALTEATQKMDRDYDCSFVFKKAVFKNISEVNLNEVALTPKNADTLFRIENINVRVSFWHLLIGELQLDGLEMKNGFIQLTKKGDIKNFQAFLKRDSSEKKEVKERDYAAMAHRIISKLFHLIPTDMTIANLTFKIADNEKKASAYIKQLILKDEEIESAIYVKTNTFQQQWQISGTANPRDNKVDILFSCPNNEPVKVPYFDERFNLVSSFDSFRLNIENIKKSRGQLHIDGFTSMANLKVNHPKIASNDVPIKTARFDYHLLLGEDFISVDSSSTVQINQIKCNPYLSYETKQDTIYRLNVRIPRMKAQNFITSLPDGLFTNFQGMAVSGDFEYKLDFMFNKNKPNTIVFNSNINKRNLKIWRFGNANLEKLNTEFEYRAIIKSIPQRPIFVGESNSDYTPINQISPYLKKCVLTTEDPSFFRHNGFITEAFKQSIIKNIETKKFTRGGSTISMQLVKNVFLTREKTLSRKLEEILLVYILENNRIVSKERMLEVYFNIIEWGPDVYGIGEASRFYFRKKPSDLSFNECLFLATIIPSPRKFMYQFDNNGNLKNFASKMQRYLSKIMLSRRLIDTTDAINPNAVSLTGKARNHLTIRKSDPIDSEEVTLDSLRMEKPLDIEFFKELDLEE